MHSHLSRKIFVINKILIVIVRFYRFFLSTFLPNACRFYPTCSCYAIAALIKHGAIRGSWITFKRIIRCNPLNKNFGFDPVP